MICFYAVALSCVLTADTVQVEGENVKISAFLLVVGPMPVQDMITRKTHLTRDWYLQSSLSVINKSSEKDLEFLNAGVQEDHNPPTTAPAAVEQRKQETLEKAGWRVWTSADGKYKTEAKFLRAEAGKVVLQKNDGTEIVVAEEKLSKEDVAWIKSEKWTASP